jgi:hypothetical protein
MFSDESTFCLWQNDRLVMVRGFRGERRSLEFTVRGHAGITPGVKRYGIGYGSPLVFIGGRLKAH